MQQGRALSPQAERVRVDSDWAPTVSTALVGCPPRTARRSAAPLALYSQLSRHMNSYTLLT